MNKQSCPECGLSVSDLRHQTQAYRNNPDEGTYGDCFRTVIACLLELPRDDVPHFAQDDPDLATFNHRVDKYLAYRHGLARVFMLYPADNGLDPILRSIGRMNPGLRFMLVGKSKTGVNHAVICQDGKIEHDPSITQVGIVGPCDPDGFYWVMFLTPSKLVDDGLH